MKIIKLRKALRGIPKNLRRNWLAAKMSCPDIPRVKIGTKVPFNKFEYQFKRFDNEKSYG
jgi:hypothetical protein